MKPCTNCPPTADLEGLLTDALPGERRDECVDHMDNCEGCQKRLEEIAVDGTNLSQVVEHLHAAEPMATSAYWPALKSLDTSNPESGRRQHSIE